MSAHNGSVFVLAVILIFGSHFATTNFAELFAPHNGLHGSADAMVIRLEPLLHLADQRAVGKLHFAAEGIAEQLAAKLFQERIAALGHKVIAQAFEAVELGAVEHLGARVDGAVAMLKDGLYTKFPQPQFALALHVDSELATGQVGFRAGYALANSDACDITMKGRGGHGSKPEACIDPILQAAQLVVDLQSIVSREVSPLEPAVITVGAIHGGTKHNIIPDTCHLKLTIRSYSPAVRLQLREAIERKAKAVATSHRAPAPEVKFDEGTSAVFNDEGLVARVVGGFVTELGKDNVVPAERVMGAEDFGEYATGGVPIFMFRLGTIPSAKLAEYKQAGTPPPSLHSSKYFPDPESSLRTGLRASVAAIQELMPKR